MFFLLFTDTDGNIIRSQDIPMASSIAMELDIFGTRHRVELASSLYKIGDVLLKNDLCSFSVLSVNGEEAYGSISFCNSIHGMFVFSGFKYRIFGASSQGKVDISITEHDIESSIQQVKTVVQEESFDGNVVKILLINSSRRVQEAYANINTDTVEIFDKAKDIFENNDWKRCKVKLALSGILNIIDGYIDEEDVYDGSFVQPFSRRRNEAAKERNLHHLETFRDLFKLMKDDEKHVKDPLMMSDIFILLQASDDAENVKGLTFIGGASFPNRRFGIIKIREADSYFYKGKQLAHEISHSLGAFHDFDTRYLMAKEEYPIYMEEDKLLSQKSIEEIESFIILNKIGDTRVNTCGNGILDETKECDSGLPFGSMCCTKECKLRSGAKCDDRNGGCCKDCTLVQKGTICRKRSQNIYKTDCERTSECDGISSKCGISYVEDGTKVSNGMCVKGIVQSESLMCKRLGFFFDNTCSSTDGQLWCLDRYDTCMLVPFFPSLN